MCFCRPPPARLSRAYLKVRKLAGGGAVSTGGCCFQPSPGHMLPASSACRRAAHRSPWTPGALWTANSSCEDPAAKAACALSDMTRCACRAKRHPLCPACTAPPNVADPPLPPPIPAVQDHRLSPAARPAGLSLLPAGPLHQGLALPLPSRPGGCAPPALCASAAAHGRTLQAQLQQLALNM